MSNEKYIFNPTTLQYEKIELSTKLRVYRSLKYVSAVVFTALILLAIGYYFFPTPKERALNRQLAQMEYYYSDMNSKVDHLNQQIDKIQEKDADVHRMIFGVKPIDDGLWNGGIGGRTPLNLLGNNSSANELLTETLSKLDKIFRKVELQNDSFDDLLDKAKEHEDKLSSIPSIKPIQEDKLKRKVRYLSGYGMRIHPIHKVRKMHHGMDFTAPTGTPIQATGNGVIKRVENKRSGYGKNVVIDHGYGYTTRYGHMSTVNVKVGEKVTKGQQIGTVGSSGTSTAPHCHYEVHINGNSVDPIDYVLDGLSPLEYQELVAKAKEDNQSFD